jgi:hypothetical protein
VTDMSEHQYTEVCTCTECDVLRAEVDQMLDEWEAHGRPLADGTHAHPGVDLADCEAKRAAERARGMA